MNNKSQADKENSEAYAVGKRNNIDVPSSDITYHNNSKYYSEQAAQAASTAVTARNGIVEARDIAVAAATNAASSAESCAALEDRIDDALDTIETHAAVWDSKADGNHTHPGYAEMKVFTNVGVSTAAWATSTLNGYNFYADVNCSGVTSSYVPDVVFSATDATSGNFAPIAVTYNGGIVRIFAKTKPSATITIQTIVCWKVVS